MAKRSGVRFPGFVLRSGYVVDFDPNNVPGMLDHLRNAIVGESLEVLRRKRKKNWMMAANQILAEIQHLATTTPHDIAQGLLVALLAEGAFDKLRKVAEEQPDPSTAHNGQDPIRSTALRLTKAVKACFSARLKH